MDLVTLVTLFLLTVAIDAKSVVLQIKLLNCDDDNRPINMTNSSLASQTKEHNDLVTSCQDESRRKKENGNMMTDRIMPLMVIPFLVSTAILPFMLLSLKALLLKSMLVGKIAAILGLLNMFRRQSTNGGEVTNHVVNDDKTIMAHYGYSGDEEYGAYINKKRRKR